jgi:ubiquinol-cytochrome c reductase core subunit 2
MLARSALSRGSSQLLARAAPSSCRGLAAAAVSQPFNYTVGETTGIKVASRDDGRPTTTLAVVARGGSRYEVAPGLAHGLEKFAFKVFITTDRRFDSAAFADRNTPQNDK